MCAHKDICTLGMHIFLVVTLCSCTRLQVDSFVLCCSLLQRLNVEGTACVSDRERILEQLQKALPNCLISS